MTQKTFLKTWRLLMISSAALSIALVIFLEVLHKRVDLRGFMWVDFGISGYWWQKCRYEFQLEILVIAIAIGLSL